MISNESLFRSIGESVDGLMADSGKETFRIDFQPLFEQGSPGIEKIVLFVTENAAKNLAAISENIDRMSGNGIRPLESLSLHPEAFPSFGLFGVPNIDGHPLDISADRPIRAVKASFEKEKDSLAFDDWDIYCHARIDEYGLRLSAETESGMSEAEVSRSDLMDAIRAALKKEQKKAQKPRM